jgi:hypothetical protein
LLRDPVFYVAVALAGAGIATWGITAGCRGGAAGITALLTFLTAVLIWYYLVETRRLRVAGDIRDEPFLVLTFEPNHNGMPTVFLRNLGRGMAVNVNLVWHALGQVPPQSIKTHVAVVSPHPDKTVAATLSPGATVQSVVGARVEIRCSERPGRARPAHSWTWIGDAQYWHTQLGGDGFRLEHA